MSLHFIFYLFLAGHAIWVNGSITEYILEDSWVLEALRVDRKSFLVIENAQIMTDDMIIFITHRQVYFILWLKLVNDGIVNNARSYYIVQPDGSESWLSFILKILQNKWPQDSLIELRMMIVEDSPNAQ